MDHVLLIGPVPRGGSDPLRLDRDWAHSEAEALGLIRQRDWTAVLVAPAFCQPDFVQRLRLTVAAGSGSARIIATVPHGDDAAAVRELFRAGADDVWTVGEVSETALVGLVRSRSNRVGAGTVTLFASPKGGTGCSTVLLHALRQQPARAVLIDLSPVSLHRFVYGLTPIHSLQSLRPHIHQMGAEEVKSVAVETAAGPAHIFLDGHDPIADEELLDLLPPLLSIARGLWDLVLIELPTARLGLLSALAPHLDRLCWVVTPDVPCLHALREAQRGPILRARQQGRPQGLILNRANPRVTVREDDLKRTGELPVIGRVPSAFAALEQVRFDQPRYPRALRAAFEQLNQTVLTGW